MDASYKEKGNNHNEPANKEVKSSLEELDLKYIIDNSYDSIFITDKHGNCLLANATTGKIMGINPEELKGKNVRDLVQKGVYNWSPTLKVLETRSVVTGLLKTWQGTNILATSTPLFDENGEISMVITNVLDKDLVDKYYEAIENERSEAVRYKTAVEYLSESDLEHNPVVAESKQMKEIIQAARVIAKTDSTVILFGESGTGKEVLARYIHRNSFRAQEPFIPVNCAAIPSELLESEFFGYVKGAFTGASSQGKPGLFEIAHKGTLFLDEIGELPLAMQSKLLRVLETGEVQRVGSTSVNKTNVRVITATNRDLKAMVNQNLFRNDLYYRLNVIPIKLAPLRDRPEDIEILAGKFLDELNRKYALKKSFTNQAKQAFLDYSWPGNVRELRNVIERLVITSSGDELNFELDPSIGSKANAENREDKPQNMYRGTLKSVLKSVEEEYIKQVLEECDGRVGEAARLLGIHRTALYRKTNDK